MNSLLTAIKSSTAAGFNPPPYACKTPLAPAAGKSGGRLGELAYLLAASSETAAAGFEAHLP